MAPRFLGELTRLAEEAGWDAVLLEDYLDYQAMGVPTCARRSRNFALTVGSTGYDFVMGGRERLDDEAAERDLVAALDEAGATWWMEWVRLREPDEIRRRVARGPVRPWSVPGVNRCLGSACVPVQTVHAVKARPRGLE